MTIEAKTPQTRIEYTAIITDYSTFSSPEITASNDMDLLIFSQSDEWHELSIYVNDQCLHKCESNNKYIAHVKHILPKGTRFRYAITYGGVASFLPCTISIITTDLGSV